MNQELRVLNGRKTTHYVKIEGVVQQGDPISVYLFVLVLE